MLFQKSNITITVVNSNIDSLHTSCESSSAAKTKKKKSHEVTHIVLSFTALFLAIFVAYSAFKSDSQTVSVLALEVLKILLEQIYNSHTPAPLFMTPRGRRV